VTGRKAGWGSAWRPGPAAERSACPRGYVRAGHAGGVVTTCNPHMGRCGGALADGLVVASRRQGVAGELMGTTGRASGNESGGGAHRGRRSTVRWRGWLGMAAFRWRAAPTIADECGEVLQLERDKGVRKWRLMEETGGSRRRSPTNGGRRHGSNGIPCGPTSSGRRWWTGGGEGCRASLCGWGSGEKMGKSRGDAVAAATILNRRAEVGDGWRGDATW
jgi:hypothetical protein